MIAPVQVTQALAAWLSQAHDDGQTELSCRQRGHMLEITRADGSELSETEMVEVRALLAAHAAEPFQRGPTKSAK